MVPLRKALVWSAAAVAAVVVVCALLPVTAQASEPCNEFETLQVIMLYEAREQNIDAKTLIGFVALGHGVCNVDDHYYTNLRSYLWRRSAERCERTNLACGVTDYLYSFVAVQRESAARAAYRVLTDAQPIELSHFDVAGSHAWFFNDVRACPRVYGYASAEDGRLIDVHWFEVDNTRFC